MVDAGLYDGVGGGLELVEGFKEETEQWSE